MEHELHLCAKCRYEHMFAPGVSLEQFAYNLSDLPQRAAAIIREAQTAVHDDVEGRLARMAHNANGVAAVTMNKW
jgi:hypothetical protein